MAIRKKCIILIVAFILMSYFNMAQAASKSTFWQGNNSADRAVLSKVMIESVWSDADKQKYILNPFVPEQKLENEDQVIAVKKYIYVKIRYSGIPDKTMIFAGFGKGIPSQKAQEVGFARFSDYAVQIIKYPISDLYPIDVVNLQYLTVRAFSQQRLSQSGEIPVYMTSMFFKFRRTL